MLTRRAFLTATALGAVALGCNFHVAPQDDARVELIDPVAESFRAQFNHDAEYPRLVMLVSSQWDVCKRGVAAVQKEVVAQTAAKGLRTYIIWLPIQDGDTEAGAEKVAKSFVGPHTRHYFDQSSITGLALGQLMHLPPSEWGHGDDKNGGAWDVYVLFPPGEIWQERPPVPAFWMHQLDGVKVGPWLDPKALLAQVEKVSGVYHEE